MNLYTDDNPHTTIKGLGFKNAEKAISTISIVENHFDQALKRQKIPGYTPDNLLPKKYINNKKDAILYYKRQKYFRIIGMRNRAKGMIKKTKKPEDLINAILIFDEWIKKTM